MDIEDIIEMLCWFRCKYLFSYSYVNIICVFFRFRLDIFFVFFRRFCICEKDDIFGV